MKANIKKLIGAIRNINGKRLCTATGITLAIAFFLATICFLGKHAPAFLVILAGVALTILIYFLLTPSENPDSEE